LPGKDEGRRFATVENAVGYPRWKQIRDEFALTIIGGVWSV
jgi:hypothetical protein